MVTVAQGPARLGFGWEWWRQGSGIVRARGSSNLVLVAGTEFCFWYIGDPGCNATDDVLIKAIVSTGSGRIFAGGSDCCVYEIRYQVLQVPLVTSYLEPLIFPEPCLTPPYTAPPSYLTLRNGPGPDPILRALPSPSCYPTHCARAALQPTDRAGSRVVWTPDEDQPQPVARVVPAAISSAGTHGYVSLSI